MVAILSTDEAAVGEEEKKTTVGLNLKVYLYSSYLENLMKQELPPSIGCGCLAKRTFDKQFRNAKKFFSLYFLFKHLPQGMSTTVDHE